MNLKNIIKELELSKSIALFFHEYPDGDAIGSSSALYLYLKKNNKNVELFSNDPIPQNMMWVECKDDYQTNLDLTKSFDVGILLDCSDSLRCGTMVEQTKCCKKLIRIDHHLGGEKYSNLDIVDSTLSSTCELLTKIFLENKIEISKSVANCLLFGILTDTNSLQNSNSTLFTVECMLHLLKQGADLNILENFAFSCKSKKEFEISKEFYKNAVIMQEERLAYSFIDNSFIEKVGASKQDMNGHANILRNIDNIDLAFVVYEIEPNYFSCSIRSEKNIASNKIAADFGGGGHFCAAALKTHAKDVSEVVEKVLKRCREELKCQTE